MSHLAVQPQTAQPKLRLKPIIFFGVCMVVLVVASYFNSEPHRAFYGGLAAALAIAMIVQYRRESALVCNALSATVVVTSYRVVGKYAPHFGKGVPTFKYEFVAFDQKTYTGQTGWGAAGLQQGSQITVLYNPENPARSHPLGGFVFYSFIIWRRLGRCLLRRKQVATHVYVSIRKHIFAASKKSRSV